MDRGVVGRERVGTAFPHFFQVLLSKWVWSCFKMASFLGAFPHLFCYHYITADGPFCYADTSWTPSRNYCR